MDFFGTVLDDVLEGQASDDFLLGDGGNDFLIGGAGNDQLVGGDVSLTVGGRDTLEGGVGDDGYVISLERGGGSQIEDVAGTDVVLILAENSNLSALNTPESFADASLYGDGAITLALPQAGIIGIDRSGTDLIVDINRNGIAETEEDLTIVNFLDISGLLSIGSIELINNITNTQDIVDFLGSSSINSNLNYIVGTDGDDLLNGTASNDFIEGGAGADSLNGLEGDDLLSSGEGNDFLSYSTSQFNSDSIGGRDTLQGGDGDDGYSISLNSGGGIIIEDTSGLDFLGLVAENTDVDALANGLADYSDPVVYGDAAVTLSSPQANIIGLKKSGTNLIIDINRDGIAETDNDLTIIDFFDEQGELTTGSMEGINNIVDSQDIVNFFNPNLQEMLIREETTVYRFFNNNTGVHFYTVNEVEKDAVIEQGNFSFEGASYESVDSLTGGSVPVYRLLNQDTGVHLYTISEVERNTTESLSNYVFESEAFFAYATEVEGSVPIYRFFNNTTGAQFYTPSVIEKNNVTENLPDFQSEGIAYYALPSFVGNENLL
ncbi:MAG: hypothetical protein ACFCAD_15640 [Pleurocapsa sp.]